MNAGDLITLQNVKDWLNADLSESFPASSDTLIARMVTAVSRFAGSYLQRNLQPANYVETRDGTGTLMMFMRQRPIISISSLAVGNTTITPRAHPGANGYAYDKDALYLDGGGRFWHGIQNVSVSYRAGFQQADVVTVATPYSVTNLSRPWNGDQGVTYANGNAFTLVTSTPVAAGTYQVTPDATKTAEYVFYSADIGQSVTITYGYTPDEIVQALVELCGERYRARDRIGQNSQSLQGMQTNFSTKDMSNAVSSMLNAYRSVVPVA